ncbi:hypothetical protein [Mesohalobacter halotolerans]|uniref:6-bladed beta-propeller n=1 Tax=Mesohalobacter halotolerans TaxID=1883405 RepID=A0A4U5TQQ8_9FLAO|nr:hypothetical protein [Mesohalobacter halotolerans]MBS3737756.1 hypothetical protein [Psychroflexus sp.]TKS56547.1 hypothetical protein FCN74_05790 [Mesohalobacter halotolerans]
MFKNLLGLKIIVFLCVALVATLLIFKDFILESEQEDYHYKLVREWTLPDELNEISGMIHLDKNRIFCIQDEDGYLFIYNLKTKSIDQKIKFGPGGDYESITKVNDTIYVLRSDGKLFEIKNAFKNIDVNTYQSNYSSRYNFEGLSFDSVQNRLLIAPKYKLKRQSGKKPIFGFDLNRHKFIDTPIYQLNLNDNLLKKHPEFMPASLTYYASTKKYYMLDGRHRRLLILNSSFKPQKIYKLNISELPQPESLSFYIDKFYISSEADQGIAPHIYEIVLKKY